MLRAVLIYNSKDGYEMPLIETRNRELCERLARVAFAEYAEGITLCEDPALAEVIRGELDQVRRVLKVLGITLDGGPDGVHRKDR